MTHAGALMLILALGPRHALTPQDRLWLASVDHVITKAERVEYEALDDTERRGFQDAFWRASRPRSEYASKRGAPRVRRAAAFRRALFPGERGARRIHRARPDVHALRQTCVSQDRRHAREGGRQHVRLTARLGGW